MNIAELVPQPPHFETFKRSRERFVPETSGCYALTTFSREVVYVGLAKNLRRRMNNHLDSEVKVGLTPLGRAALFFWIESNDIEKIERTWMNIHIQQEGGLPVLNSVYSPVST
ncbi:GIY-YIG nuclease family protein [Blastochloris sulfoviridis]|uniref:GIY-YIG nuclease family protein n=1 Tax=Blastochloris sulfoviridis TaxID=50712 RepID=A0A5M6HI02_9HYPH|nr:GIY-YIG nuclease family protein [Blastochloris sulfoviridis]KAA5595405.1 GIY-YIG nuclease family protein [Blastochloris sulfoviridis]